MKSTLILSNLKSVCYIYQKKVCVMGLSCVKGSVSKIPSQITQDSKVHIILINF